MTYKELAVALAAHMVEYEQVCLPQFVWLCTGLVELFFEETVSGSLFVGDHAVSASEFLEIVVKGLNASDASRPTIGQRVAYVASCLRFMVQATDWTLLQIAL
jgi:hypothetical protein